MARITRPRGIYIPAPLPIPQGQTTFLNTDSRGNFLVNTQNFRNTYTSLVRLTSSLAGHWANISGSSTNIVRILSIVCTFRDATSAAHLDVVLLKNSTPDTGGTFVAVTATPHDSTNPPATAIVLQYSVIPTAGTAVANIMGREALINTTSGQSTDVVWNFFGIQGQELILRNTSEQIVISGNNVGVAGSIGLAEITWVEE